MINNKYLAEFIGTAILVLVITGSGIMGYDLSRGNLGIALLINSIATGIALFILISIFINISGAHFNPLVTLVSWAEDEINNEVFIKYFLSQLMGALLGIMIAHLIFYLPIVQFHPTGMVWPPSVKGILVTESVRGDGGVLKNSDGKRFMSNYIPAVFGYFFGSSPAVNAHQETND